jgi:hypothetical protein
MHSSTPNEGRKKTSSSTAKTGDQVEVKVVADERIHPYTCHVISHLFPSHTRGQTFMFGLLSNAVFKRNALTDLPAEDRRGVAIVSLTQGCAELSQRVDLGYDTTQMYLAIYRTLGLLYYVKQGEYTTISIPLDAYRPPSDLMERLYQLRERYHQKRPRMRRLVDNIIERIAPFLQEEPEQFAYSAELLHRVRYVLATQGVADSTGLIAQHIVTEIATFVAVAADNNVSQEIRTTAPFTPWESTPTSIPTKCKGGRYGQNVPDISPGQNNGKGLAPVRETRIRWWRRRDSLRRIYLLEAHLRNAHLHPSAHRPHLRPSMVDSKPRVPLLASTQKRKRYNVSRNTLDSGARIYPPTSTKESVTRLLPILPGRIYLTK